jgi:hypothetical protein
MTPVRPIPPDAVRVWRGFQTPAMQLADFLNRLNTVFVPATVLMQIQAGLDGYIPTVPAGLPNKPASTPDETAILFWDSAQTYRDGFGTLAVRTYTLTHAAVYAPGSRADFPLPFAGTLTQDQPFYLVDQPADWMHGHVTQLLGGRPDAQAADAFAAAAATAVGGLTKAAPLDGAIVCAGSDYLVAWVLSAAAPAPDGVFDALATVCGWSHTFSATPTHIRAGMWDQWAGLTIQTGDSVNMQFKRRWET